MLITITERKFQSVADGGPRGAYLRTRQFIAIREPVKTYGNPAAFGQPYDGRGLPFRRAEITTLVTPNITTTTSRAH